MPEETLFTALLAVALGVVFNFISGFQDPASSIATSIATRALNIPAALSLLAVMNFFGAIVSHKVAYTVATGVASPNLVTPDVVAATLLAALVWNVFIWYHGIPSSASHALISALFGASMAKASMAGAGYGGMNWPELAKILTALFTSPVFGFIAGFFIFRLSVRLIYIFFTVVSTQRLNRLFARAQPVSAALMAFSNGSNDAQKTMGLMALALYHGGVLKEFIVPWWITLAGAAAISLGALAGGYRIIKTITKRLAEMQPIHGFSAEIGSAGVVLGASFIGMPVSTTHVTISSVVGVGASKKVGRAPRKVVRTILYAWAATIPASVTMAGVFYWLISRMGGYFFFSFSAFVLAAAFALRIKLRACKGAGF